ncbi:MAG: hypothetical protein K6E29_00940 [Cyanobacteria bacterium RUI128]|nr:hypothetical protein [Cyanobacteria bacterium RUI128]
MSNPYSEYQDIIQILNIEEPDLYDLEGIKNDVEYKNILRYSETINIYDYEAVSEIYDMISDLLENHRIERDEEDCSHRAIDTIAYEIIEDWGENISDGAKPYLKAMTQIVSIDEMYGSDSATSIIGYFLANAEDYQGKKAERLKQELQNMLDNNEPSVQMRLF